MLLTSNLSKPTRKSISPPLCVKLSHVDYENAVHSCPLKMVRSFINGSSMGLDYTTKPNLFLICNYGSSLIELGSMQVRAGSAPTPTSHTLGHLPRRGPTWEQGVQGQWAAGTRASVFAPRRVPLPLVGDSLVGFSDAAVWNVEPGQRRQPGRETVEQGGNERGARCANDSPQSWRRGARSGELGALMTSRKVGDEGP